MSDAQQCTTPGCVNGGMMRLGGRCWECVEEDRALAEAKTPASAAVSFDPVTRPAHYEFASISPLDAALDWQLNYLRGCVLKYLVRAGRKGDELEDLRKAAFCLQREIARLEAKQP